MAEKKYDLLLGPRKDSNLKIRFQPWYRERLSTKYDRKLVTSSWTFIKDGVDDFRDGKPPPPDSKIVVKGMKGIKPSLFGSNIDEQKQQKQRISRDLHKNDVVYSKCAPSQRRRKNKVELVEKRLLQHPLALCPDMDESLPADLLEDVIDLLDPSLTLDESNDMPEDASSTGNIKRSNSCELPVKESANVLREACSGYNNAMKNGHAQNKPCKETEEEDYMNKEEKQRPCRKTNQQSTKIEYVTSDFCNWVRGLGGDTNNIEESTVNNLFASGYDTKPALSVPVHVVELTNVPPELRADVNTSVCEGDDMHEDKQNDRYTPSWVKVKYGAWYLDPKTWKVRRSNDKLPDPKEIEGNLMSESRKKSKELDKVLATLHGARSLRAFIDAKGARNPEFLDGVTSNATENALKL